MALMMPGTMMSLATVMLRMDILAGDSAHKGSEERTLTAHACMHAKSYDTHQVPYGKHSGTYFHRHISQHNTQMYKKHSKVKENCSTFVIHASNLADQDSI
jgi:hypothetical protein